MRFRKSSRSFWLVLALMWCVPQLSAQQESSLNGEVYAIAAASNGDLYVGGRFAAGMGNPKLNYIGRWDGSAWHALGEGLNGPVYAIAIMGSDVYVGGDFECVGNCLGSSGLEVNNIARGMGVIGTLSAQDRGLSIL